MRFSWRFPKQSAILILDTAGSDLIRELCGTLTTNVLDREILNIPVILTTLLRGRKSMSEYQNSYIRRVNPQVIITLIDNDLYFLNLKHSFPSIATVAVQNGIRANYAPRAHFGFFSLLKKADSPACDYYCVFNTHVGKQLSRVIQTMPIITGSIKNNQFRSKSNQTKPFSIGLVSQHPPRCIATSSEGIYFEDKFVSDRDFYQVDLLVASYLARFSGDRGFEFTVCGKRDNFLKHEFDFFSEAIGDYKWNYAPRTSEYSTYETLDEVDLIVSIDSTLGYEFFARGKRTAFFTVRGSLISNLIGIKIEELDFGWPQKMDSRGSFWTDTPTETEFVRILDYLTTVSDNEWTREIDKYTKDVMVFDQGNTVLRGLLQRLGADLIDQEPSHA